jgi:hypothetical protein
MSNPGFVPRKWLTAVFVLLLMAIVVLYQTGDLFFVLVVAAAIWTSGWCVKAIAAELGPRNVGAVEGAATAGGSDRGQPIFLTKAGS